MPVVSARISAALFLSLFCVHFPRKRSEKPSEEAVWFAVEERPRGELRIEPFVRVEEGQFVAVPSACSEADNTTRELAAEYLKPGESYPVVFGGTAAGEVRVLNRRSNSFVALVTYEGSLKLRGQLRALATNHPPAEFRPESRQAATKEDRAAALALARELFQLHGIPAAQLSKVHTDFLTRTVLEPSPLPSWIGSFTLGTNGDNLQHNLFFIATPGPFRLEPQLVWVRLSQSADEDEAMQFVDHADLLGDGHDEIVVTLSSTPNHRYAIYEKSRDGTHWERVFLTELMECF